jgi:hypothetical protein
MTTNTFWESWVKYMTAQGKRGSLYRNTTDPRLWRYLGTEFSAPNLEEAIKFVRTQPEFKGSK